MASRTLLAGVFLVMIVVFGIAIYQYETPSQATSSQVLSVTSDVSSSSASTTPSYTLAQVAQHNSASSCWSAINGNVYDLTQWIDQHPGGSEDILSICGTDGSAAFNAEHAGQAQPAAELQGLYIGTLAQ